MSIQAIYLSDTAPRLEVKVYDEKDRLIIEDLITGEIIDHWPLAEIQETLTASGLLQFQCTPNPNKLEFADAKCIEGQAWARKLPSRQYRHSFLGAFTWLMASAGVAMLLFESVMVSIKYLPREWEDKYLGGFQLFKTGDTCRAEGSPGQIALDKITRRLFPLYDSDKTFSLNVVVVKRKEVNALTFLAGKIYLFDGLLQKADSADEIAGVLAHEIEHVNRRHIAESVVRSVILQAMVSIAFGKNDLANSANTFSKLARLQFSRQQEKEADTGGIERLVKAHVNVAGYKNFFDRASKGSVIPTILSTHPSDESRMRLAESYLGAPSEPVLSGEEWLALKNICEAR